MFIGVPSSVLAGVAPAGSESPHPPPAPDWSPSDEPIGDHGRNDCNIRVVLNETKTMFIFFTELSPRYYGKYFDSN